MTDQFTETTHKSWFSRLGNAFSGILFGFLLLMASIVGLFWNEGRAVNTYRALVEGAGQVVTIDPATEASAMDGKLVHFSGPLEVSNTLSDPVFTAVNAPQNANRLSRKVEMYQWVEESRSETRKKLGGGEETVTTYTYTRNWSDDPVESGKFKQPDGHANPPMAIEGDTFSVEKGTVGQITLPGSRVSGLGNNVPIAADQDIAEAVAAAIGTTKPVTVSAGQVFIGSDPASPQIGDMRISFNADIADRISAVGLLTSGALDYYKASNGVSIGMVQAGDASASAMFDQAQAGNTMITWLIRGGGLLAMAIAFSMIFAVIGVIGDVIPMVGDVFRFATGMAALALTAILGPLVIGVAWIWYRPMIGLSIIAIGVLLAVALFVMGKKRAAARQAGSDELIVGKA